MSQQETFGLSRRLIKTLVHYIKVLCLIIMNEICGHFIIFHNTITLIFFLLERLERIEAFRNGINLADVRTSTCVRARRAS